MEDMRNYLKLYFENPITLSKNLKSIFLIVGKKFSKTDQVLTSRLGGPERFQVIFVGVSFNLRLNF